MEKITNGFHKCEYEFIFKQLKELGLGVERHGGDYIKGDLASIRIDIVTPLDKKNLRKKIQHILDHEISARLSEGKKNKYSNLTTYLLSFEVILP